MNEAVAREASQVQQRASVAGGCAAPDAHAARSSPPMPRPRRASTTGSRPWTPPRACAGRWQNLPGPFALSSSFGAQAAVSLHLVAQADPDIPVLLIDTGYLFPETYQFIEAARAAALAQHPDVREPAVGRRLRGAVRQALGAGPRRARQVSRAAQGGAHAPRRSRRSAPPRGSRACAAARPRAAPR